MIHGIARDAERIAGTIQDRVRTATPVGAEAPVTAVA
jgi:hypothetical protein